MALNNVVKKFDKSREKLGIDSTEQIVAACMTDPKAAAGLAVGGLAGAAVQAAVNKSKQSTGDSDAGLAAAWPTGRHLMAITSKRVLVCSMTALAGKPKEIVAEWPIGEITSFDVEKKKLSYVFTITFTDGSVANGEGAKGSGADTVGDAAASIWG